MRHYPQIQHTIPTYIHTARLSRGKHKIAIFLYLTISKQHNSILIRKSKIVEIKVCLLSVHSVLPSKQDALLKNARGNEGTQRTNIKYSSVGKFSNLRNTCFYFYVKRTEGYRFFLALKYIFVSKM